MSSRRARSRRGARAAERFALVASWAKRGPGFALARRLRQQPQRRQARRLRVRRHRPHSPPAQQQASALDALAAEIDLSALSAEQFVQLLRTLLMLGESGSGVDPRSMRTEVFVRLVAQASKAQLRTATEDPALRAFFLEEVFDRMAEHLISERVRHVSCVLSWRFTADSGAEMARYQTVVEDGTCVSGTDLGRSPDTTLTLSAQDFVRVATGNAALAPLFIRGRVGVKGDYALAAKFSSYFAIPKPEG